MSSTVFDRSKYILSGTGVPASAAAEPAGNFRTECKWNGVLSYDDPIVYPGQPGKAHLHLFFGNTGTNANSTYDSLRATGDSSCAGGPLNRSGYWMPALLDAAGMVHTPDFITVYYKDGGVAAENKATGRQTKVQAMPAGLKMIAGYNLTALTDDGRTQWECDGPGGSTVVSRNIPACPSPSKLYVRLAFPQCWDGQHLDSSDHRSHLAYRGYFGHTWAECPSGFPVPIPQVTLLAQFTPTSDTTGWSLSSDMMVPGQTPGLSFHADWFGAWDPQTQQTFTDRCLNGLLDCQFDALGDGTSLSHVPDTGHQTVGPVVAAPKR